MGLIHKFECIQLAQEQVKGITFFSPQSSDETVLFEIAPQTIDDLFCHHFQTDQLLVVRGSMVVVCLQNRQYHYILMSDRIPQVVKIPAGVPHLVINLSSEPCWVINALIRHGVFHPKDYQPLKKPFPLDMERVKTLLY
jgi:mannose-6-phosphate isomerase-like protein (cupin superfamily)